MSQKTVEVVRAIYEAFARGDIQSVLSLLDPQIEWNEAENFIYADRNPYIVHNALLEGVFMRLGSEWEGFSATANEILDSGDKVVVLGYYTGRYKNTGREVRAQFAHIWSLNNGKAIRFQ